MSGCFFEEDKTGFSYYRAPNLSFHWDFQLCISTFFNQGFGFGLDFEAVEWGGGTRDTVSEDETFQDLVQGDADAGAEVNSIFRNENEEDTNRIQVEDEHDMISGVDAMIGALRK